jgi:hypothetical protein
MDAPPDALTFVVCDDVSLAKQATVIDGTVCSTADPSWPRIVGFVCIAITDPDELLDVLSTAAEENIAPCVVRAHPIASIGRRAIHDDPEKGPAAMRVVPRSWAGFDIEKVPANGIDPLCEPEKAVKWARQCLPPQHHDVTVVWQLTASAGIRADRLRMRLWFLLDTPVFGKQLAQWCEPGIKSGWLDPCTLKNETLPHFIAVKIIGNSPDPCPQRWGIIRGKRDRVPIPARVAAPPATKPYKASIEGGDLEELQRHYGPRLYGRQCDAIARIRAAIEEVRASGRGARHPTYLSAAARIAGICKWWCIPPDRPRQLLEEAYRETLTPDEIRKRERGSIQGVPEWVDRRDASYHPDTPHPVAEFLRKLSSASETS